MPERRRPLGPGEGWAPAAGGQPVTCQQGNPAPLPVVPTIARGPSGGHTASMAPSPALPHGAGPPLPAWEYVDHLEVARIVQTILQARKTMPWATAATVSREQDGDAVRVRVTMLGRAPAAGRAGHGGEGEAGQVVAAFLAGRLGADLARAFGDGDVITLE